MKLAVFTPLSPSKTGISDYNQELLPKLSHYIDDIDIYFVGENPTYPKIHGCNYIHIDNFNEEKYEYYDQVIYHIGNNSIYHEKIYLNALMFPGIVVLHDYSLHHLIAKLTVGQNDWKSYIEEMLFNYGENGENMAIQSREGKRKVVWETENTLQFPLNKRLLQRSTGLIVHSNFIQTLIKTECENVDVEYAPLFANDINLTSIETKISLKNKHKIPNDVFVFSSFGFVSRAKRVHIALKAIKMLKDVHPNILYLVVGEDEKNIYEVKKMIKEDGLDRWVKHIGFVELNEFKDYIQLSDVCINLRFPTQGESSASLLRILGYGKPAIISEIGTFQDFDDNCTIKIPVGDEAEEEYKLYEAMLRFIEDKNMLNSFGENAYQLVKKNYSIDRTTKQYLEMIKKICAKDSHNDEARFYFDYLDSLADKLHQLKCDDETDITRYSKYMNSLFFM